MIGIYSIILGIVIVIISLALIRKEFQNSFFLVNKRKKAEDETPKYEEIVKIEEIINSMNEAFYDLIGDMEGRSSLQDHEIKLINEKMESLEKEISDLKHQLMNIRELDRKETETVSMESETWVEVEAANAEFYKENYAVQDEPSEPDVKTKIILLRSRGFTVNQIAKELNIGVGEINLILNMKK